MPMLEYDESRDVFYTPPATEFEMAVTAKIVQWRQEYADLDRRGVADVWGLIAAEVKKYGRGRSPERDREKLVTVAAMAKLGFCNSDPHKTPVFTPLNGAKDK